MSEARPALAGVKVRPLDWVDARSLVGRKLVAIDCFGREFARLDYDANDGNAVADPSSAKVDVQAAYERCILSAVDFTAFVDASTRPVRPVFEGDPPKRGRPRVGENLTDQMREVLHWGAEGKTAEETAIIMDIGLETVRGHRRRCTERLGCLRFTQACVKHAVEQDRKSRV